MSLLDPILGEPAVRSDADFRAPAPRLLAYVTDPASAALLTGADASLPPCEVRNGDIRTAIRDLERQRCPDLLLVDLTGVGDPLAAMEALARVCAPSVRVVAIGDSDDIVLHRNLRRLGVTDCLFKPLSRDPVEAAVRAAGTGGVTEDGRNRLGKLIAVVGARGGVGATTVAVHLAAWLSEEARGRTALVDLDLQGGTVALALRLKPEAALREAVEAPDRVDDLFMERAMIAVSDRLAVLAAEEPIKDAIEVGGPAVLSVLNRLRLHHNHVVADVGRPQGPAARAVLEAASLRVLVGDGSLPSLRDLARLRAAAPSKPGARVITALNRLGSPGELAMADLVRTLGEPPNHCLPYRPVPLAVAAGIGEPAFRHCRRFREAMARLGADVAGGAAPFGTIRR